MLTVHEVVVQRFYRGRAVGVQLGVAQQLSITVSPGSLGLKVGLNCCYLVVTLLLYRCYIVVTLLLHCRHTVVIRLDQASEQAYSKSVMKVAT
jgi:hypothetical protein